MQWLTALLRGRISSSLRRLLRFLGNAENWLEENIGEIDEAMS